MIKSILLSVFFLSAVSFSAELPKFCFGKYAGEREAYNVIKNDLEMTVDKHDVQITITAELVVYKSGGLVLKGAYTFIKQSGKEYLVVAKLSNGKSLNFDLEFIVNKKEKNVYLNGKNGEPAVILEKITD